MKKRDLLRLLMAVPFAYSQGLQKAHRSLSGHETISPEDFSDLIPQIPSCALNCLTTLINDTSCTFGDLPCMCGDEQYFNAGTVCVREHCMMSEALATMNLTQTACGRPKRDISGQYTSMNIASGVVTIILVLVRLFFKRYLSDNGQIGPDDWVIFVAIIISVPAIVINQVGLVGHGIGKDIWTLPAPELPLFAKFFFIGEIFYFVQMSLVKLSLSLFYLYVFPGPNIRRLLIGTAIFNVVFGVVFVITAMTQCIPLDYYWAQYYDHPPEGRCFNLNGFAWANAGLGLAVDVWMIILPLIQIKRLNLHWKKKIGVVVMFILGTFVSIISLLRLKSVIFFAELINPTWDQENVAWWSTMEVNIGIICTCLPTVRLILQRMFPKILSSGDEQSNDTRVFRAGGTSSGEETQQTTFPVELLSTTTLATDARSSYKHFDP
ncbi:putative PTH11-type G-protein coupled receptor protein [Trichoderma sp. SZMC 28013]